MNKRGFTIVELLIVIVVIGILAAISIVAYSGIQKRAQDARIRSAAHEFAAAFQRWSVSSGKVTAVGGSGSTSMTNGVCVGGGGGWVLSSSGYACTVDDVLKNDGYIPSTLASSVPNVQASRPGAYSTLMLYACGSGSPVTQYVMMYALNTPDAQEMTDIRNTCAGGGAYGPIDTYGMTGGFVFTLTY